VLRPGAQPHPDAPLFITDPGAFRPTMFCFLKDWAARAVARCVPLLATVAELDSELMRGADPVAVHRRYCRLLAGVPATRVAENGKRWAAGAAAGSPVADLLRDAVTDPRRRSGAYLISDAVDIVASSVMRVLGACDVLATRALIDDRGLLTVEVADPVVGAHRGAGAVRRVPLPGSRAGLRIGSDLLRPAHVQRPRPTSPGAPRPVSGGVRLPVGAAPYRPAAWTTSCLVRSCRPAATRPPGRRPARDPLGPVAGELLARLDIEHPVLAGLPA